MTSKSISTRDLQKTGKKLGRSRKARKTEFKRHESWRYKRLKENWRKPRGLDNKMRLKRKGWPKSANVGFRGPKTARGLHPSGFAEVLVHTVDDIGDVDPSSAAVRIAHTVGTRKRIQIASLARERGIHILNPLVRAEPEEEIEEEIIEEPIPESEEPERKPKRPRASKEVKNGAP